MNLTRRATISALPLAALAACTPGTSTLTPAVILTDASAVVTGLANGLTVIKGNPLLVPYASLVVKISADLTAAAAVLTGLNTSLPAATGASIVQTIEGYINDVLSVATTPPLGSIIPAPFSTALGLASVVLPVLEAFVNQYIPAKAGASLEDVAARTRATALAPAGLSVQQAVQQLQGIK
jgi:hypothetical protein